MTKAKTEAAPKLPHLADYLADFALTHEAAQGRPATTIEAQDNGGHWHARVVIDGVEFRDDRPAPDGAQMV